MLRNTEARLTPFKPSLRRNEERCKRDDSRSAARVLQRTFLLAPQDGLGFAGCSSDFDPLWPTAPPRRGYLYRCGVGRTLR
jgi:hypothetical protein